MPLADLPLEPSDATHPGTWSRRLSLALAFSRFALPMFLSESMPSLCRFRKYVTVTDRVCGVQDGLIDGMAFAQVTARWHDAGRKSTF
ncbi:hypothetical protein BC361_09490 [Ensifer sp. LC54]|nr:hypothetical protein BC361_09490 [Ensifer sp. LC54]OCP28436.1 hypothetical protein BC363_00870 [Ensifer sp. LC384]